MLPATGLTICHGVHSPTSKLSNQDDENREISPSTGNPLLGSELPIGIQSSNGGAQLVELAMLYILCPATSGLKARVKKQRPSMCMQYSTIRKKHVQYRPAAFTDDNIRTCAERAIPPAFLLLYHCYFPCTCLPAVAL